ncbi:hypothetical protein VNI00_009805 [Paramarasmius palmivorus]|uniref:Uncharacterized protein n=1 Tax=Paramarasmius palmivorus TaxID=297713 RepID=A0AAW0CPF4_9AGAR
MISTRPFSVKSTTIDASQGCSVLSYLLSRRTPSTLREWKALSWGKICMIWVLFDSWFFTFFSGVLLIGTRLRGNPVACSFAIISCIIILGSTKLFIYAFLVEKVLIVWSGGLRTARHTIMVYGICGFVMLGYLAVGILFLLSRRSEIRKDAEDACYIGVSHAAAVTMVTYDLSQNIFFTGMFLWPLWRSHLINPSLKRMATRTLSGAIASLTLSAANASTMIAFGGEELGWMCLSICVADLRDKVLGGTKFLATPYYYDTRHERNGTAAG